MTLVPWVRDRTPSNKWRYKNITYLCLTEQRLVTRCICFSSIVFVMSRFCKAAFPLALSNRKVLLLQGSLRADRAVIHWKLPPRRCECISIHSLPSSQICTVRHATYWTARGPEVACHCWDNVISWYKRPELDMMLGFIYTGGPVHIWEGSIAVTNILTNKINIAKINFMMQVYRVVNKLCNNISINSVESRVQCFRIALLRNYCKCHCLRVGHKI